MVLETKRFVTAAFFAFIILEPVFVKKKEEN